MIHVLYLTIIALMGWKLFLSHDYSKYLEKKLFDLAKRVAKDRDEIVQDIKNLENKVNSYQSKATGNQATKPSAENIVNIAFGLEERIINPSDFVRKTPPRIG